MMLQATERWMQAGRAARGARTRPAVLAAGLGIAIALWCSAARAESLLEIALHAEAERRGDFDALAAQWLEALPSLGGEHRAELLLRRLESILHRIREPLALIPLLEGSLAQESSGPQGISRELARGILKALYLRAGRREEAERLSALEGVLRSFLIIGPFGKASSVPLRQAYAPEREIDLAREHADGWQSLRWRAIREARPDRPIQPQENIYPTRGIAYLLAQVRAAEAAPARLQLVASGRYMVWLNGALLVDDRDLAEHPWGRRAWDVDLREGWNRILVKTSDAFLLRLTGVDDEPLPPGAIEEEKEPVLHEMRRPAGTAAGRRVAYGAIGPWEKELEGRSAADDAAPDERLSLALEHLGLAILYSSHGRHDLAVERAEKALELAPDDLWVLHHAARTLRYASYLPESISKNRSRRMWETIAERDPGFLPAHVNLARFWEEDEQEARAVSQLRRAIDIYPGFFYGLGELHRVFDRKGWEADARRALDRIRQVAPQSPLPAVEEAQRYRSRQNHEQAAALYREALGLDRSNPSLLAAIAQVETERGRVAEAEAALREWLEIEPESRQAAGALASLLSRAGRHEEALALRRAEVEKAPWDPEAARALGDSLERAGDARAAEEAYRRAVELAPGQLELASYVDRQAGRTDEFWRPYDETLEDWLGRVPDRGPLVEKAEAVSVLDLSIVKVYPDGSSSEYIHQAFRLLTEEAKDDLANVQTPGTVIALRTLLPDGTELEPVAALGRGRYVMPGLVPGATTEYAYLVERARGEGRPWTGGPFFFQDFRFRQSFLLSRFAMILPPGVEEGIVERNIRDQASAAGLVAVEKRVEETEGGGRVIVYEARNSPRIEAESWMPSYDEYVPNVRALERQSWGEVADELRERVAGATLATPELRAEAGRIVEGIDDPAERMRAIHAHVIELVANPQGSGSAVRVLLEKSGDRTALFKALLDLAGVPAHWAYLRMPEAALPRTEWAFPSSSFFPTRYLRLEGRSGEPLWVSLASRDLPLGRLPERFGGGTALVLDPEGYRMERIAPVPPEEYASGVEATYRLSEEGAVAVELVYAIRAEGGFALKERFRNLNAFQRGLSARGLANQLFPGAEVKSLAVENLDDREAPLAFRFSLSAPRLLTPAGDGLLLQALRQPAQMLARYGGPTPRKHPYHLRATQTAPGQLSLRSRVRIEPTGTFRFARIPASTALAHELALFSLQYRRDGDAVVVERDLSVEPGRLEPGEFAAFLEFCEKVDAAERESVVVEKVPAPAAAGS